MAHFSLVIDELSVMMVWRYEGSLVEWWIGYVGKCFRLVWYDF